MSSNGSRPISLDGWERPAVAQLARRATSSSWFALVTIIPPLSTTPTRGEFLDTQCCLAQGVVGYGGSWGEEGFRGRSFGGGGFPGGRAVRSREFPEAVSKIFSSKLFQGSPMILFRFNVSTNHPPLSPHSRPSCHNLYSLGTVGNPPVNPLLLLIFIESIIKEGSRLNSFFASQNTFCWLGGYGPLPKPTTLRLANKRSLRKIYALGHRPGMPITCPGSVATIIGGAQMLRLQSRVIDRKLFRGW